MSPCRAHPLASFFTSASADSRLAGSIGVVERQKFVFVRKECSQQFAQQLMAATLSRRRWPPPRVWPSPGMCPISCARQGQSASGCGGLFDELLAVAGVFVLTGTGVTGGESAPCATGLHGEGAVAVLSISARNPRVARSGAGVDGSTPSGQKVQRGAEQELFAVGTHDGDSL